MCSWRSLWYPEMLAAAMNLQNAMITSWSRDALQVVLAEAKAAEHVFTRQLIGVDEGGAVAFAQTYGRPTSTA